MRMPNKILNGVTMILLLLLTACSDTSLAHMEAMGQSAHIVCYSADTLIFEGDSTGKVTEGTWGWEFMDRQSDTLVRVNGNCVIQQNPKNAK
jgi:hypothetical protein